MPCVHDADRQIATTESAKAADPARAVQMNQVATLRQLNERYSDVRSSCQLCGGVADDPKRLRKCRMISNVRVAPIAIEKATRKAFVWLS